ncbi:chemotaxis protein CheY [Thermosipho melanesiensis]|uniref:Protein-glutamate methylesterase/protein-glutamine glutaminase n=2 Tax=Thermosipho melanesiensis TaxID=46541 RepID=A6LNV8_THEM4|nr:chemotaxis response regulator protein-glutamate methylesterase [Thermosipho melanesiensis]ABR31609.1 response regulator receiver modulated CheB methylesterase [Thermosipho melanesiensis BI429]APT74640.1 chemotaxis protein CheY [Thermosipho melanesiensis]OOC35344.1 chemotaxis protein CheY [Thermosipho melanesiensis]OOC35561.1 chemotaxis protein CheY [Thermosipho melanesiensis]OOC36598.1 chemotaxis protein CheY [Thermosipho melanesiensis]
MEEKIKVLIVDDSAFMRMILKDVIEKENDMKVVGIAKDGLEAVELAIKTKPDVITLDVEMPKLNGIEALKEIMKRAPARVIMVSSLTEEGADITITALELGAVDFITKPAGSISMNFRKVAGDLIKKIRNSMQIDINALVRKALYKPKTLNVKSLVSGKVVVIGSSTGGPKSLDQVIPPLPANFPAPIILVQHMPAGFTKSLANRLNKISNLNVKEAEEGDILKPGWVYIAPGDYHLGIKLHDKKSIVYLEKSEKINNVRPAVDFTLDKVAEIYKDKTVSVILTGMGKDGTKGAFKVKYYKGIVIAESKETCVVYGMPKSVIEEGYADFVLPAYKIPEKLVEII